MPILEFALDATALYRVQVHLNTHQGPVSVMLNRSALGSLTTLEEQAVGKDFRLPDSSILRVQILNGHPQAWCNGFPLAVASVSKTQPLTNTQPRSSMGRGVTTLLILNTLLIGILSVWFFAAALLNMSSREFFLPFLLTGLLSLVELIGIFALFAWKKWGLYLALCSMLANFILAIVFGIIDYRTFLPLAGLALLYLVLSSSGIWHKLD